MDRMLDLIRQMKILSLSCIFSFHNLDKIPSLFGVTKLVWILLKVDFTEKVPFGFKIQESFSGLGLEGMWIFKIAFTEVSSNNSFNIGKFQVLVLWLIRQATYMNHNLITTLTPHSSLSIFNHYSKLRILILLRLYPNIASVPKCLSTRK